jgi:hypothetical protein
VRHAHCRLAGALAPQVPAGKRGIRQVRGVEDPPCDWQAGHQMVVPPLIGDSPGSGVGGRPGRQRTELAGLQRLGAEPDGSSGPRRHLFPCHAPEWTAVPMRKVLDHSVACRDRRIGGLSPGGHSHWNHRQVTGFWPLCPTANRLRPPRTRQRPDDPSARQPRKALGLPEAGRPSAWGRPRRSRRLRIRKLDPAVPRRRSPASSGTG